MKEIIPVDKVYDDAISPAMKQIGKSLESVAKTSRFLLAPFTYLAAQHDKWERRLQKVAEKVEADNLMEGHPQIVIPTLEGLSLSYENTLLSELFINLLANSIDKTKQDLAHPAFPTLINQISHDEAVILFLLKRNKIFKVRQQADWISDKKKFVNKRTILEELPVEKLNFPEHIWIYMSHLVSLNLAGTYQVGEQQIITNELGNQTGVYINSERRLLEFGEFFVKSCVPDEFEGI